MLVEAESQLIGRIYVPDILQSAMAKAPLIVLEAPLSQRVELLRQDYVTHALEYFKKNTPNHDPWLSLQAYVCDNLRRIRKRLGGQRCDELLYAVPGAVRALRDQDDWGGFDAIIECLLDQYYDKLYAHKMQKREQTSVFRGDRQAVLQWLAEQAA